MTHVRILFPWGLVLKVSATKLRQNLYKILDDILNSGIPVEIERNGKILKIIPEVSIKKMDNLKPHKIITGSPEDLISVDWESEWNEKENLK